MRFGFEAWQWAIRSAERMAWAGWIGKMRGPHTFYRGGIEVWYTSAMFFSAQKITRLIAEREILIEPFDPRNLKMASYSFTLGTKVRILRGDTRLDSREDPVFDDVEIGKDGYELPPGGFAVFHTYEKLTLNGKYIGILSTRATVATMGIDVMQGSLFCEPDTDNVIALETTNRGTLPVVLYPGTKIIKVAIAEYDTN